jgi:hypothetical protein
MEDDVTKDLAEFSLANAIYAALVEAHACEQSARYVYKANFTSYFSPSLVIVVTPWTMHQRTQKT